mmetsp:Transcript_4234/g.6323  ORF Transcript_4234/g.6323 Transcript_4234/m.6323 type:complete len:252 (-) Transcript_4234:304-1059(-)
MRFRFCGELDAPDWILAEISTLSRLSPNEMEVLSQAVVQDLLGRKPLDLPQLCAHLGPSLAPPLCSDVDVPPPPPGTMEADKAGLAAVKGAVATVRFVATTGAGQHGCDETTLHQELGQLGLPMDGALALVKPVAKVASDLRKRFAADTLRVARWGGIDWRVDSILGSSAEAPTQDQAQSQLDSTYNTVRMRIATVQEEASAARGPQTGRKLGESICFNLSENKFQVLLAELREARSNMARLQPTPDESGV